MRRIFLLIKGWVLGRDVVALDFPSGETTYHTAVWSEFIGAFLITEWGRAKYYLYDNGQALNMRSGPKPTGWRHLSQRIFPPNNLL